MLSYFVCLPSKVSKELMHLKLLWLVNISYQRAKEVQNRVTFMISSMLLPAVHNMSSSFYLDGL